MGTKSTTKIRGITIKLGGDASGIEKALKDVNNEAKNTQKQLKDVERLLKLDPTNVELLRQKNILLNKSVEETEEKLNVLRDTEKKVQEQFEKGTISEEQYNALKREIASTEIELKYLEGQAKNARDSINKINEKPIEEVADAAQKAEEELEDAGKEASNFGDYLKAGAIVEGAKGLISTLKDVSEETKELNMDLSRLDQNAKDSGTSIDSARKAYKDITAQFGETDSAIEAVSNLMQAGFTESNLQRAVEGLSGAALKFPDTLKIESLADSLQETIATNNATGQFAELMERLGLDTKKFSEQLADCSTEAEKQNLALQMLEEQGLNATSEAWKKNNEALYESNQAQADLQEQMVEVGELVMPYATKITEVAVALLTWFNNLDSGSKVAVLALVALVAAIGPMLNGFNTLTGTTLPGLQKTFTSVFGFITAHPIVLLVAAVVAMVALFAAKGDEIQAILQKIDNFLQNIFATDFTKIFGPILGEVLNSFFANVKNVWDSVKLILDGLLDFIRGIFTGDWERAWNGIINIFRGIFSGLSAIAKAPINAVIGLLNGAIGGMNTLIKGANKIPGVNIGTIGKIPYLANGGTLYDGSAVVGEAGPELLTVTGNKAVVQPLTNQTRNSYLGGVAVNVYAAPGQDVDELADLVADRIKAVVDQEGAAFG